MSLYFLSCNIIFIKFLYQGFFEGAALARGKTNIVAAALAPDAAEDTAAEGWGVDAELGLDEDGFGGDEEREHGAADAESKGTAI